MTSNEMVLLALKLARGDRVKPRQLAALRKELQGRKGVALLVALQWSQINLDQLLECNT